MEESTIFEKMEQDIYKSDISEEEKQKLLKNILNLKEQKINLLITGATGCGKSSTINALFETEKAKVGVGVDPETMDIQKYELNNMVLWDSPGLGDGKEADNRHSKNIISKLMEKDANGKALIDLVLVILDGGSRDLGTSYELINQVIIPNLGPEKSKRILVAINQADMAMKGRYWDREKNCPEPKLIEFLEQKVQSVQKRIKEGTGVDVTPIYYSAGFKDEGEEQRPYNLAKLLYYIMQKTPKEKRLVYVDTVSQQEEMWKDNDDLKDYRKEIKKDFLETVSDCATEGAYTGEEIGSIFGEAGAAVGRVVGGVVGTVRGVVKAVTGCYITTAVCEMQNKPDDCYELTMFRKFRDEWLAEQPNGKDLIQEYYEIAPTIVNLIDKDKNRTEIYENINRQYLLPCLKLIEEQDYEECKEKYVAMVENLRKHYIS